MIGKAIEKLAYKAKFWRSWHDRQGYREVGLKGKVLEKLA
jgi:hypothetical protein